MDEYVSKAEIKAKMIRYGFYAPDMAVTEFVEDELISANVAPVVLCKDCKYAACGFMSKNRKCAIFPTIVWEDDYCSYGERGDAMKARGYAPQGQEDNWA